ncbi:HAD hydrolase-like protein [Agromyces archimandritae]|uniref:HAD hydrolase-like protein n=1 Tax=Agromyces archimandritae TaxID=2781962 RepID=A0A975FJ34_9MICO|nr:HAD hydrolase-like protein [Agromyces archimandritae]QTX03420.1 HAD hydrolase-like protein [Agromyces archimandritae]
MKPLGPGRAWSVVLFDLDGTIVDSAAGIVESLAHTFEAMGAAVPSEEILRSYVGPPLLEALRMQGGFTDVDAWNALSIYRDHYGEVAMHAPAFAGLPELLGALADAGIPLAVATSKPEPMARRILEHLGLASRFAVIAGASEDETRSTKADIVSDALARLRAAKVDTSRPVMVGDRGYDVVGASANEVPTILVAWGYGSPIEAHDAIAVADTVDELAAMLTSGVDAASHPGARRTVPGAAAGA